MSRNPISIDLIAGLVLAGGQGRRMSADGKGLDKGLQLLAGKPMVAHVIARLEPQVGVVLINANQNIASYEALGYPVFADDAGQSALTEAFAGPLAGLYRGLSVIEQMQECDYLVTVPCDSPFLPDDLVARLASASVNAGASVAVAKTGDQVHPVFMLVKHSALPSLVEFLKAGGRKIDAWYASLPFVEVPFEHARAFDNVNTLQDLTNANSDDRLPAR